MAGIALDGQRQPDEGAEDSGSPYVVIQGRYRAVKPRAFDFVCNVRRRWVGTSVVDVFSREFPGRDREYYQQAVADGRLRAEGRGTGALAPDTPLRDGMRLRHLIHLHEPLVPAGPVQVVGETPDIVAVCKPPGMPVHESGHYRLNTVQAVLASERPDLGKLLPIHRLDKPVSGVLLFARHASSANALSKKIEGRAVEKVYVARVLGAFPASDGPIVADVPLGWDHLRNHAFPVPAAGPAEGGSSSGSGSGSAEPRAGQPGGEPALDAAQLVQPHDSGAQSTVDAAAGGSPPPAIAGAADAHALPRQQQHHHHYQQQKHDPGDVQTLVGEGGPAAQQQPPPGGESHPQAQQHMRPSRAERRAAKQEKRAAKQAAAAAAEAAAAARGGQPEGKPALTEYRLLWVAPDGQTSLVECMPRTGRTHQIRVHLQHLGHPIANDAQYGGTYPGPLPPRALARELGVSWEERRSGGGAELAAQEQQHGRGLQQQLAADVEVPPALRDPLCPHCPLFPPVDFPLDMRPLWLHAQRYACADGEWSFSAELPEWAQREYVPPPLEGAAQERQG